MLYCLNSNTTSASGMRLETDCRGGAILLMIAVLITLIAGANAARAGGIQDQTELIKSQGQLIKGLQQEVNELKNALETVKRQVDEGIKTAKVDSRPAPSPVSSISPLNVSTKGGIKVETADGEFKAQLGGRLLFDSAWYQQDDTQLGDGTAFRAARLFLAGTLFRDWHFKGQYDFADNDLSAKDVFISYTGLNLFSLPLSLKVGQYKPPFSMEQLTSLRFITFMERGLSDAFVPGRIMGLSGWTHGENWGAGAGVFGSTFGGDADDEGDEGWSGIARATVAPIKSEGRLVHLGGSVRYNNPNDEGVRFRAKPESNITDERLVDTGVISDVDRTLAFGAELAGLWGPMSIQSQWVHTQVNRSDGNGDANFQGGYVFGSYFLTGESRNYDHKLGAFGRITPLQRFGGGGWGAWELIARFSWIDLNDDDLAAFAGGREDNITLGLNWYPNSYTRFMANYVMVDSNHGEVGVGEVGDDDPSIFQIRAQVDF